MGERTRELFVLESLNDSGVWLPLHGGAATTQENANRVLEQMTEMGPKSLSFGYRVARYIPAPELCGARSPHGGECEKSHGHDGAHKSTVGSSVVSW